MMATTYDPIQSVTLASSAASVTFSSIPQTFTDLVIRVSMRASSGVDQNSYITFNSVTSGYSETLLYGASGTAGSARVSSQAKWLLSMYADGASNTSNTYSSGEAYIPNYAGSSAKVMSSFSVVEENGTSNNDISATAALNSSTAAITSLTIAANSISFLAGSTFHLYGIKNS